jgi:hypothetical protein
MWPFSVEKGEPGLVEGCHRQFKLATNNSISHHEHVLYRFKLGYEPINQALDFGQNGARILLAFMACLATGSRSITRAA